MGPDAGQATWSLPSGADAGKFMINSGGALSFRTAPNYESATDADGNNVYHVTVQASDDGMTADIAVTVTVTNVDEDGMVTVPGQPVVGFEITATLADDDGVTGTVRWQWAREATAGAYEDISGATSESYTPVDDDGGKRLQVTASYSDGEGSGKSETATTTNPVEMRAAGPGDANNDGMVDKAEMIEAFRAYVADPVSKTQIIAIFRQYVEDAS